MDEKIEFGKKKRNENDEKSKKQIIDQFTKGTSVTVISKKMQLASPKKTKQLIVDHICEQLKAGKTLEMIAESLNKFPAEIVKLLSNYTIQQLQQGVSPTILAEKIPIGLEEIIQYRNTYLVNQIEEGESLQSLAQKFGMPKEVVKEIWHKAMIEQISMGRMLEEVAFDFRLTLEEIWTIQMEHLVKKIGEEQPLSVVEQKMFEPTYLKELNKQHKQVRAALKKCPSHKKVAQKLNLSKTTITKIQNLAILIRLAKGKTIEDIEAELFINRQKVQNVRNQYIAQKVLEGKTYKYLHKKINTNYRTIASNALATKRVSKRQKNLKAKSVNYFEVDEKTKNEIIQLCQNKIAIKTIAKQFSINIAAVLRIRKQAILTYLNNGVTKETVRKTFNLSPNAIPYILQHTSLAGYPNIKRITKTTATIAQRKSVVQLINRGYTIKEVASLIGISKSIVRYISAKMRHERNMRFKIEWYTKEKQKAILSYFEATKNLELTAARFNVSKSNLRRVVSRATEVQEKREKRDQAQTTTKGSLNKLKQRAIYESLQETKRAREGEASTSRGHSFNLENNVSL